MYTNFLKRIFDLMLALLIFILASPLVIVVMLLLAFRNKGDVFFHQKRPGKNEKMFGLIKFKTMRDLFDEQGNPLPDKDRITPIGRFIRKTSLDELPQLINVLKGDMSLVGPRPLLVKYLPLYSETQKRRHEVKPGITGWAQVNGRNAISWQEKFNLDVYYVEHCSFWLDLKILWLTIVKVFKREGIDANQQTTMKPFTGNETN